jgi:serine/threonine protein kinase
MTNMLGTPLWMAPELLAKKKYDSKVDVYAYGIVLFEILTQVLPWAEITSTFFLNELCNRLLNGERPRLPENLSCLDERYMDLMRACWAQEPQDRPSFADVSANTMFTSEFASRTSSMLIHQPDAASSSSASSSASSSRVASNKSVATLPTVEEDPD